MHGAAGRMGRSITETAAAADDVEIVTADYDVMVDFTRPDGAVEAAGACRDAGRALVSGTTGLDDGQLEALRAAAADIPVVYATNMSIGINLLTNLVGRTARSLGEEADVEILEAHHRHKVDAPSGTALSLGRAVTDAWDVDFAGRAVFDRSAVREERRRGSIGFQSLRGGDIVGEHKVLFALNGERLELAHRVGNRGIFAEGALRAARWIVGQSPGFYGMDDVLGLGGE